MRLLRRNLPSSLPSKCGAPALTRVCGRFGRKRPFEIYRHLSTPETIAGTCDRHPCRFVRLPRRAGIECLKLLSRLTFSPEFLPSLSGSGDVAQRFGWALSFQHSPPHHRSWVRTMSPTVAGDTQTQQQRFRPMQARPRAAIPCEQCRPVWPRSSGHSLLVAPATTRHPPRSSAPTAQPCRR